MSGPRHPIAKMEEAYDVLVVGSANVDLTCYVPHLPRTGETLLGREFRQSFGGKGANQAVMAAQLGAKVAMIAKVGKDSFGSDILTNFERRNVHKDNVFVSETASTGIAAINVDEEGQNSIVIVPGANHELSTSEITSLSPIIQACKILICQLEIKEETSLQAMKIASENNCTVIFNPAPMNKGISEDFFRYADIVCPNEVEAEQLTGIEIKGEEDAKRAAECMMRKGAKAVVITMGKQGVLLACQGPVANAESESGADVNGGQICTPQFTYLPCSKVERVVDTVGAGDAFIGSLAFSLARKFSLERSIQIANIVAGKSVQKAGAQTSYPVRSEIDDVIFE